MKKVTSLLMMLLLVAVTGWAAETGTINFGSASGSTPVNATSVTGDDDLGNTWTITTVAGSSGESFTQNASYSQIGASKKPASSITFTTTLPETVNVTAFSAKFGGFNGTAGDIALKVGETTVGSGSLNAANDVTVESTAAAEGDVLTVTVTGIEKGVKAYYISYTYETGGSDDPTAVGKAVVTLTQNAEDNTKLDVVITAENAAGYYYTVDGSDPIESQTAIDYAEATQIDLTQVASPVTVKAVGYDSELEFGPIGEATFTLDPITITFDPVDGTTFTESQHVTVTVAGTIGDAEVVYKVNGTEVNSATGEFDFTETSILEVDVLDVRKGADIVSASATYTKVDPSAMSTVTFVGGTDTGSSGGQNPDELTKDIVTLNFSSAYTSSGAYRIYSGSTVTVSVPTGYMITEVVFTPNGSYSTTLLSLDSGEPGSYSNGTWTGSAASVTFKASAQFRANEIAVTYEATTPVDPDAVGKAVVTLTQNAEDNTKLDVAITAVNAEGYYYTVDGSDPTESSTAIDYAEGAQIDLTQVANPVTVKAVGYNSNFDFGEVGEATFTLDPITITFDPASRNFTESQDVTVNIANAIGNAEVVYKVNGTEVNNATGEFTFTETSTLEVEVLDERAGADIVTASATYTKVDLSQYGKIVFDDNGSDDNSAYNFDPEYVVIGSDLISSMTAEKAYKGKTGIKLSSGSANGSLQITLSAPVNVTKVSVWASAWVKSSGDIDSGASIDVNSAGEQAVTTDLVKYDFDITGELEVITINANKRIYVKGIDWTEAPAIVTLEEALAGEGGNVTLSEPVKVVSVANGVAYASNGTDWVALKGDFAEGSTYKNISGVIGDLATLPVIDGATGELDSETQITAEVKSYDLASPSAGEYAKPKAAQVVKFRGFVFEGFLRGYSNNTGESLKLIGADALEQGTSLLLTTAIQYDEAAAPVARRAQSSETFAGISAVVLGSETPTAVDGIVADKAVESVRYYNVAGQVSSKPFDGMNIVVTRMVDGTVKTAKVVK